jgi:nitrogen fixation-related uncharacterized protein
MEVVALLLYVGLIWVTFALALFFWNVKSHGHEHADRLAVLPLEDNWTDPQLAPSRSGIEEGKSKSP